MFDHICISIYKVCRYIGKYIQYISIYDEYIFDGRNFKLGKCIYVYAFVYSEGRGSGAHSTIYPPMTRLGSL